MSKNEILEHYLNLIYFGNGAYGIKAAAERYFGKPDQAAQIGESALLAGLIQSPEALNPVTHPDRAARRRVQVLDAMVEPTRSPKTKRERRAKTAADDRESPDRQRNYFTDEIMKELLNDDPAVAGDAAEYLGPDERRGTTRCSAAD